MDDYPSEYENAIRYSADNETVHQFLNLLSTPEHNETRWGAGDTNTRLVAADAFQDVGRDSEADLLRGGGHVVVHNGEVKPGRFTTKYLDSALRHLYDHFEELGGLGSYFGNSVHEVSERPGVYTVSGYRDAKPIRELPTALADTLSTYTHTVRHLYPNPGDVNQAFRLINTKLRTAPIEEPAE